MFADEMDAFDTDHAIDSARRKARSAPHLSLPRGEHRSRGVCPSERGKTKGVTEREHIGPVPHSPVVLGLTRAQKAKASDRAAKPSS